MWIQNIDQINGLSISTIYLVQTGQLTIHCSMCHVHITHHVLVTHQVRGVEGLHVDVAESVVAQSVEYVGSGVSQGVSTTDCLETGNTEVTRRKEGQNKTKQNKIKRKIFQTITSTETKRLIKCGREK